MINRSIPPPPSQAYQLLIIKNEVEVAQFQNNIPEYLPLSEEFWRDLSALPSTYDPASYRSILQLYGTHYMAEGSLGGEYQLLLEFDSQYMSEMSMCCFNKICSWFEEKGITCIQLIEFNPLNSKELVFRFS